MSAVLQIIEILLPILYLGLTGLYARNFFDQEHEKKSARAGLYGLLGAHLGYLTLLGVAQHAWPLGSMAEFLSVLSVSLTITYAITERAEEDSNTGMFFLGIASIFQVFSSVLMEELTTKTHPLLLENPIYGIHVAFTVLGFAALAVGALDAVMYILLSRQLKSRELGLFFRRLPPLIRLETMSRIATITGIVLLGVGLALGHFVAIYILEDYNLWDPKVVIMDAAWALYFVGFLVVKLRGLSGIRMGYLSLAAYLGLMLTMILSNMLTNSFHSFQP
jgi:ABC-type uncharacterized transport system permease subunit